MSTTSIGIDQMSRDRPKGTLMMKNTMLSLVAALALLMISGCSTPVYENQYAVSEGWRIGKVTKLVSADEFLKAGGTRCQEMEIRATDRFVFIQRQVTRTVGHFAKVESGTGIAVGDEVYFNPWKCAQPPIVLKVPHGAKTGQTL
jgi:hypothetical protein